MNTGKTEVMFIYPTSVMVEEKGKGPLCCKKEDGNNSVWPVP